MISKTKIFVTYLLSQITALYVSAGKALAGTCKEGDAVACLSEPGQHSEILKFVNYGLTILGAAVFVVAIIMIIVGGIQYTTANGNPQAVAKAKEKLTNVLIGLLAFIFLWSFMQWLIPGGIFDITQII